jgi:hypothetical protein
LSQGRKINDVEKLKTRFFRCEIKNDESIVEAKKMKKKFYGDSWERRMKIT